jgi:hypothetical protein
MEWLGDFGNRLLDVLIAPIVVAMAGLIATFVVQKLRQLGIDLTLKQEQRVRELALEAVKAIEEEARRRRLQGIPMGAGEKRAIVEDIMRTEVPKLNVVEVKSKIDAAITDLRRGTVSPPQGVNRP